MHSSAQELVNECWASDGVDPMYWPDIERWITETVDGMYIEGFRADPFGPSTERDNLRDEALELAREKFDNQRDEEEDEEIVFTHIGELLDHFEIEEDIFENLPTRAGHLDDQLYEETVCGMHMELVGLNGGINPDTGFDETDAKGVLLHTIVENSDAEFSRELMFPFSLDVWDAAVKELEQLADEAWREANDEDGSDDDVEHLPFRED